MRMGGGLFGFLAPDPIMLFLLGASGGRPVFDLGRWWTVFSASWLHGSLLHIIFNMMWVRDLGPASPNMYGAGRMVIIYTVAGRVGLPAELVCLRLPAAPAVPERRGRHGRSLGIGVRISRRAGVLRAAHRELADRDPKRIRYALILGFFGFVMRGVDNFAHAGGFFGGYLAARYLDPLKPERIDHIVIAVICLAATFARHRSRRSSPRSRSSLRSNEKRRRKTKSKSKGRVCIRRPALLSISLRSTFYHLSVTSAAPPARTAGTRTRTSSR